MSASLRSVYEYKTGAMQYALYLAHDAVFTPASLIFCYLWVGDGAPGAPTFEQAWQSQGLYVFLPLSHEPGKWDTIAANLYDTFQQNRASNLRFAWADDRGEGLAAGIGVKGDDVKYAGSFEFQQMEFRFPFESKVTPNADYTVFFFAGTGFEFVPDRFNSDVNAITGTDVQLSAISGLFNFNMVMDHSQLKDCNAGLHYYYSEARVNEGSEEPDTYYTALNYPVLKPAALKVQVSLDFKNPENTLRTKIEITGNEAIPSLISTTTGHFIQLQPQLTGGSQHNGFSLVNYPDGIQQNGKLCFNLQGTYSMQLPAKLSAQAAEKQLLCGLSGTEHIGFAQGDLVDFIPGNHAYAPDFSIAGDANMDICTTDDLLAKNDYCTTSWVQVRKSNNATVPLKAVHYYTQPQGAPLFFKASLKDKSSFLDLFDAEAGHTFDAVLPNKGLKCFPMVPYGGVSNGEARQIYSKFERQVINPTRKQLIVTPADLKLRETRYKLVLEKRGKLAAQAVAPLTTTPQGLLVRIDSDEATGLQTWQELILAVNNKSPLEETSLRITNLSSIQRSAFQTNQQFLVVSKQDSFGKIGTVRADRPVFHNTVPIADWPFHINIGKNQYGTFSNVLIFKFCPGTLAQKVANSCSWTQANDFVGKDDISLQSRWLQNYFNNIDELAENDPSYANIRQIIHDPNWNGTLALNVDIGLNDFPEDLKGLLGGMDTSRLKAHHFGIDVNTINSREGHIAVPTCSSMFGLIDYDDSSPAVNQGTDFDFKVLKLKVLFKNSKIIDFSSKVKLTVNKLFGDVLKDSARSKNFVLLDGSYENHNGKNTYIFNAKNSTVFNLDSDVLKSVEFNKVQFSTLHTDKDVKDAKENQVKSKFAVWGKMSFLSLSTMDAFSFDKLSFSSLNIKMDFTINDPSDRKFSFDSSEMTFDMLNSVARQQSLVMNFPVSIAGLTVGDGTKLPKDANFLNVESPLDKESNTFNAAWYALTFNVNLGSAGALASQVGFTAKLMVAWCAKGADADEKSYTAALFFQLPGAGKSDSAINLQSVLKLAVGGIKLVANQNADKTKTSFLLKLNKIVVDVFGKKLPPSGNTEFFLFGDPNRSAAIADPVTSSLGWYASYQKDKK